MAEVLGKTTNMIPSCKLKDLQNQHGSISVSPKSCSDCRSKSSFSSLKMKYQALRSDFHEKTVVIQENGCMPGRGSSRGSIKAQDLQMGLIGKSQKWWENGVKPNMREVNSAQDLVDSLLNAGDKLAIVDFFSPGCGGCKALHPKICQLAESNPDVQFQVNYEEHNSMCYSLNVHVLPFFRFYRGAHGRLCSFSCTNATIKKFKDDLAKHTPDQCSLGPPKGLEEKELLALAANKDRFFNYIAKPVQPVHIPTKEKISVAGTVPSDSGLKFPLSIHSTVSKPKESEGKSFAATAKGCGQFFFPTAILLSITIVRS
ncbi:hypothetical protein SLE2022_054690 [Rubroshorea leprosula]